MNTFQTSEFYPIFQKLKEKGNMQEKDYQIDGISWAIKNETTTLPYDVKGGIIADEMGLGKTFQMISVITCHFKRRTLIVLPPILIHQWVGSFIQITGHKPFVYHSNFVRLNAANSQKLYTSPIVITTYGMLITTKKKPRNILHSIAWNRIIYDEAHHLKNKNTAIFKGALLMHASIKWFITGTPIQNKLNDLYSLYNLLGIPRQAYKDKHNKDMIKQTFILRRTKKDVDISVQPVQINHILIETDNMFEMAISDELHSILPFYSNIKEKLKNPENPENPENQEQKEEEDDDEESSEEEEINEIVISTNKNSSEISYDTIEQYIPESRLFSKIYNPEENILPVFMRARQLCIYPPLFQRIIKTNNHLIDKPSDFLTYEKTFLNTHKLDTLVKFITERKDNDNKKIIFCYFKNEINYIYNQLNIINIKTEFIDGRINNTQKNNILSSSPHVLLLQVQTSCEGLNLQEYSEVYFTSPHWNPAIENQAIARCHRIGQTKIVEVFKLITVNPVKSIEQYILDVQKRKKNISKKL